jgi:molybdate transport system ATP-binding protein
MLLDQILNDVIKKGIHIILVTNAAALPACITHVATVAGGLCNGIVTKETFESKYSGRLQSPRLSPVFDAASFATCAEDFSVAIKMVNTNVRYDERDILNNINWEVKCGERWSISGHNGSGKSTLLSLVNGDNPQAFANAIWLFDRKKGSGESIWDIKKKIGFVSPELHHYFDPALLCWQVVASGLFDTIGLFRRPDAQQLASVDNWLSMLALQPYRNRYFNQLSNGEQRLVLLARALVKNPPLLILDEPCQGLDAEAAARFIALVDQICIQLNKTLVYVTHYEAEVPSCVTRKLKLENGSIAA